MEWHEHHHPAIMVVYAFDQIMVMVPLISHQIIIIDVYVDMLMYKSDPIDTYPY